MAVSEERQKCSFELLSPSVKKLYKSATKLPNNKYLDLDEIKSYVAFNDYTFIEKKLELILEEFIIDSVSEENSLMLSIEKLRLKHRDFYDRVLKSLCPFFYMCHLAITSPCKDYIGGILVNSATTESPHLRNDELFSWVSEEKIIQGRYKI